MNLSDLSDFHWWLITILPALGILLETLAILSALHALRHVRTSQATVAWVVVLIILPFIALPFYWVLARHRFEGYREAIREVGQRHRRSVAAARRELSTETNTRSTDLQSPIEHLADVLDTPISEGNEFELLIDGDAFFDAMIELISDAKTYVYASFYIIRDDAVGNRFAQALIDASTRGVTVRLLYDEVGCLRLSNQYISRLLDAGVDVRSFNTRQGFVNRFQINFRNHRKLLVVDGQTSVVGGMNVADEYTGKGDWFTHWRDTALLVHGPLTRKVQAVFAGDYYWAARSDLPEAIWPGFDQACPVPKETKGRGIVCATGPADLRPRATMMFAAAAATARHRLWISTPYLVPDEAVMVALSMARARGVDVRLLIPSIADLWTVYLAGFYYEQEFADLDISVYRYQDGFLHQKAVLVDHTLALIGSTNLDNRSLHLNFEMMVATEEPSLINRVAAMLESDFTKSKLTNRQANPMRPWFARAGTGIARLFSPVL